jgi:hypothetical protein
VDDLVVDKATLGPGLKPSVHSFSIKQRNFSSMSSEAAVDQFTMDALEARTKYGGTVEVRRPGHPLFGKTVNVSRVHVVYDGKTLLPELRGALSNQAFQENIALHFYEP